MYCIHCCINCQLLSNAKFPDPIRKEAPNTRFNKTLSSLLLSSYMKSLLIIHHECIIYGHGNYLTQFEDLYPVTRSQSHENEISHAVSEGGTVILPPSQSQRH